MRFKSRPPDSSFQELQRLCHERLVALEDAPMPGILTEHQLGVRKAAREVNRVAAGHHLVVLTIRHQRRSHVVSSAVSFLPHSVDLRACCYDTHAQDLA